MTEVKFFPDEMFPAKALSRGAAGAYYTQFVAQLKANPGVFGLLERPGDEGDDEGNYAYTLASLIRNNRRAPRAFFGAKWEVRVLDKKVYIKYLRELTEAELAERLRQVNSTIGNGVHANGIHD
jgi:hypothetical protein